ncbi:MAG: hypothetical protein LHW52_06580, partial [Candidatus Cloacimonetes bacterium]|nr:hypothetical protein [Candidatus Cloacimonadota bacterium]
MNKIIILQGRAMKSLTLCFSMLMMFVVLSASITHTYQLDYPVILENQHGIQIKLAGAESYGTPGDPDLPFYGFSLLLPLGTEGREVIIKREGATSIPLKGKIAPVQPQYPLSHPILEEAV